MWDKAIAFHIELGIRDNMDFPPLCIRSSVWTSCKGRWKSRGNWKAASVSLITLKLWSQSAFQTLTSEAFLQRISAVQIQGFAPGPTKWWSFKFSSSLQQLKYFKLGEQPSHATLIPYEPKRSWMFCGTMDLRNSGTINCSTWCVQCGLLSFIIGVSISFTQCEDQWGQRWN